MNIDRFLFYIVQCTSKCD